MLESKIESKLVKFCRENGICTRKFASPSNRGVPDRIFCKNGKVLFLELKRTGEKPTALQYRELDTLQRQGMKATWSDNYEDAAQVLSEYFEPKNLI